MSYCRKCYEETGEKVPVAYKMFDIDGYNLEEFPTCPNEEEHNEEFFGHDIKTEEDFSYFHLLEEDLISEDEIEELEK